MGTHLFGSPCISMKTLQFSTVSNNLNEVSLKYSYKGFTE